VRARVRTCVRACVHACVHACVQACGPYVHIDKHMHINKRMHACKQLEVEFVQADIMAATAGGDGGDGVGGGEGERGGSDKGSSVKGSSCLRPGSYDLLHDKGTLDAIRFVALRSGDDPKCVLCV